MAARRRRISAPTRRLRHPPALIAAALLLALVGIASRASAQTPRAWAGGEVSVRALDDALVGERPRVHAGPDRGVLRR
jgi:hypothetical protein